jgi:hypothetical protein
MVRLAGAGLAIVTLVPIAGCEPDFDVDGAFFPAWIVCMAGGAVLAIAAHGLFVRAGIDDELGPPALVYPSLYILLTLLIWIVFFRT